ncbi:DUF7352 domain-containing protein [Actinomadura rudentiformis]|uniref:DUF7352 domain-containing protein n=1 Tax=Actinomadura rudentiformis TaxID=359158 RepID=A0A6H9YZA8_9ACTN|nr:hypothetical protein [Actinomadura rudentiformis]KAB2347363.1 hypothetical protein F8566_20335 [Actinomadura rudentiformis]
MGRRVYRHRLIVGSPPHTVAAGTPLHCEAVRIDVGPNAQHGVDFWTLHDDGAQELKRTFQVFGTGHDLPDGARYWGTTARTEDGLVWHLFELEA